MQVVDALAIALVLAAASAFAFGDAAFARADNLRAFYWLTFGIVALRGASRMSGGGAS